MSTTTPAPRSLRILEILRAMMARPSGAIGLTLVAFHLALAVLSPWIVPFDYKAMDATLTLAGPSPAHWLGTDHLGRDVLTRVMLGGREALLVTGTATPVALIWGGLLGVYLGLKGGWRDEVAMRLVDAISDRDLPVVQAITMIVAITYVGVNLLADILSLALNPRLRSHHMRGT